MKFLNRSGYCSPMENEAMVAADKKAGYRRPKEAVPCPSPSPVWQIYFTLAQQLNARYSLSK